MAEQANQDAKDQGVATLDALPLYSVIIDNISDQTWVAVGRKWPEDTWLWMRIGSGDGPLVAVSRDLKGRDLVLLAEGLHEPRRLFMGKDGRSDG